MRLLLSFLTVIVLVIVSGSARAMASRDFLRQQHAAVQQEFAERLLELRSTIEANQGSRPDQLEEYLDLSLGLVYKAKAQANADRNAVAETNADLSKLVELGYLSNWPANPLSDWQPMRVLSPQDPFSAGDLVLELCPPTAQSKVKGSSLSVSFNIYVYGLEGAGYAPVSVFKANESWSRPPLGALNGHSFYLSSSRENAERKARIAERKAREAAEALAAQAE